MKKIKQSEEFSQFEPMKISVEGSFDHITFGCKYYAYQIIENAHLILEKCEPN